MRIWRLELGLARKSKTKSISWEWGINASRHLCGCWIFSIGPVYVTWLSGKEGGCYSYSIVHLKKKYKKKKKTK